MYSYVVWPPGDAIQDRVAHLNISEMQDLNQGDENMSFPEPNQTNTLVILSHFAILKFFSVCLCVPDQE